MRVLVLLTLATSFVAAERAEASGCFLGPFSLTIDPPLGCEVVVVSHAESGPTSFSVKARRTQGDVDITGPTTTSTTMIDVPYTNYNCDGSVLYHATRSEAYNVYRITLTGAQVGDHLLIDGIDSGHIAASGACSEDITKAGPGCTGLNSGYPCPEYHDAGVDPDPEADVDESEPAGCNAGGDSAGMLVVLLALLLLRARLLIVPYR